ncbi:hypothetical protein AA15669_0462 [Saccharibacter floricola DSM 15669]|uniref:Uncharacterized protein n=1 Tax=Saccharibacter floricola DSM 15669 TaxID=1123227 RepID=A0ABQ0NWX6_9PROT|nr:hypothetical protein AA15669_0462 [Saccharibacter floricola DSM 15669]
MSKNATLGASKKPMREDRMISRETGPKCFSAWQLGQVVAVPPMVWWQQGQLMTP